jgi:hypothetical protein
MNELMNTTARANGKCKFLMCASAITLTASFPQHASAGSDGSTVWLEVGTQLERLTNEQENFAPPFVTTLLENPFTPPSKAQKPPRYSFGQEGRLLFSPSGSGWIFSASVRYGRANSSGSVHEETRAAPKRIIRIPAFNFYRTIDIAPPSRRYSSTDAATHESELVMDFQAGRDVGLGAFGRHGTSTINAGIRFAQFMTRSRSKIGSDPDFTINYKYQSTYAGSPAYIKIPQIQPWNIYSAESKIDRSFSGIGPSLEWGADVVLAGNPDKSEVTFDWGLNGAVLFGHQKASGFHMTSAHHGSNSHGTGALPILYPTKVYNISRSHSVIVPNLGGFAGLSMRFPSAKVSLGYRVDAFFGAMDGGIDTRKTYDRDFYGPFATISIGLP